MLGGEQADALHSPLLERKGGDEEKDEEEEEDRNIRNTMQR